MQLSAANLLIASQQLARGNAKPTPDAPAQFASALAKQKGVEGFEPMNFKSAPAPSAPAPAPAAPAKSYNLAARLGANIDIRV
ncbi:MAG TPA: hypothetical protein VGB91_15095 [Rhizomicrobium sp.]